MAEFMEKKPKEVIKVRPQTEDELTEFYKEYKQIFAEIQKFAEYKKMEFLCVTKDELLKNGKATFASNSIDVEDSVLIEYFGKFEKDDGNIDVKAMSEFNSKLND